MLCVSSAAWVLTRRSSGAHSVAPCRVAGLDIALQLSSALPAEEAGDAASGSWGGCWWEATADSACTCPADRACSLCSRVSFRSRSLQHAPDTWQNTLARSFDWQLCQGVPVSPACTKRVWHCRVALDPQDFLAPLHVKGAPPVAGVQVLDALLEAVVQAVDVGDAVVRKAAQGAHRRQVLLHVLPQPLHRVCG
jgi:hypothetical protein